MKKILNVGVIGLGRIGRNHLNEIASFPDLFKIVAGADHDPERRNELCPPELKDAALYTSLDELLQHPELDMVTIATRHPDHVPMAIKILEAGKIAVVEKPTATSTAEFDSMLSVAAKYPHKLFLRHNRRFEPAFVKVRELIDAGLIGEVQYIKLYRSVGYCRRNDWLTMPEFYGGLLTNWGPHLIDQALQLLASPVKDIFADIRRVISIGQGDDLFKIILKGANGLLADIEVSGANAMPGREMEIIGSRGTLIFENGKLSARYIDPCVELKELQPHPENPPLSYGNFDEQLYFVNSEFELPKIKQTVLWKYLYDEAVNGIPSVLKLEEGREVVRITEEAFKFCNLDPVSLIKK
ncbi:MAG: Gfo/Idh/MocA family oxidoreductase [Lentisphaeria bacterium]|nr:Gfo/Idh/MocA family oxidoreductase [Lentisphaeria bacterium]